MHQYKELFERQNAAWQELHKTGLHHTNDNDQKLFLKILTLPHRQLGLGSVFLTQQRCWVSIEDSCLVISPNDGYKQEVPYQISKKGLEAFLRLIELNRAAL